MRVLKIVGGVIGAIAATLIVVGLCLPDSAHVERSVEIAAPACNVFALVEDLHRFNDYSPWAARDTATTYTFTGADWGVGQRMAWASDDPNVGTGALAITAAKPCERLDIQLDFGPQGIAQSYWTFQATGATTRVTWGFDNNFGYNLMGRYFGLFMDGMIGPDYQAGLARLATLAESLPKADVAGLTPIVGDVPVTTIAYVTVTSATDPTAVTSALAGAFAQDAAYLHAHGISQGGPPVAVFTTRADTYTIDAGIPLATPPAAPPAADGAVRIGQTPTGQSATVVYQGPYSGLAATHDKLATWLAIHGREATGPSWEEFVSDPGNTPEAELVTNIRVLLK